MDRWNEEIVDVIQESVLHVAGKKPKDKVSKISDSTRKLNGSKNADKWRWIDKGLNILKIQNM